jgi:hypothetical protein
MDNAVALVQAYLRVNGYFTVTEYPVVEAMKSGEFRTATDLDLLAFRFPGAGRPIVVSRGRTAAEHTFTPDAELGIAPGEADMLVGEVKEGRARLNEGAANPAVLRHVLTRFGCCPAEDAPGQVDELLRKGHTVLPSGHRLRLVVFASLPPDSPGPRYRTVFLGHVVRFLQGYLREHWEALRHAESKDPAFGFLVMIEKALAGSAPAGGAGRRGEETR